MAINANGANLKNCGVGAVALKGGKINAEGADFSGCGIGAMADIESEINVNKANLENCGTGLLDVNSNFIEALKNGEVDIEKFVEMLNKINNISTEEAKVEIVKEYGFFDFINKYQAIDFVIEKSQNIINELMNLIN